MSSSFGSEYPVHILSRSLIHLWRCRRLPFDDRTTYLPFTLIWNNDWVMEAPIEPLCHFWVIWAHLLAQNTQSIWYLGKLRFEAFWRSWLLTTEPPNSLVLLSWIMLRLLEHLFHHFAIFGLYELIFWLRIPSPYTISVSYTSLTLPTVALWRPNHLPTLYFNLK